MSKPIPSDGQEETERQQLFQLAMRGKWKDVVSLCKTNPDFIGRPLTRAEDTTIHVVISAGGEGWVIQLLDVFKEETKGKEGGMKWILTKKNDDGSTPMVRKILEMQNEGGSTPMHLAAALGMERACWEMASLCPDLVTTVRNKKGETPLFTAVQHGKKEAFFALEHWVQKLENYLLTLKNTNTLDNNILPVQSLENKEKRVRDLTHCRRDKDGNNILHCAIFGEYFDLAYEIIDLYPKLNNYVNAKGELPLKYLANKPSCFRSGIRFCLFDAVIYNCINIGPLQRTFKNYKDHRSDKPPEYAYADSILPETCDTISLIFTFIKSIFYNDPRRNKKDEENKNEEEDKKLHFPEIYEVGVALFKLVMKVLLVILGKGLRRTQKLKREKRKNTYANELMKGLVKHSKAWEYHKDGRQPHNSSLPSKQLTQRYCSDLEPENLKPESSEDQNKITDHEYPRSKHPGIKRKVRICDNQLTVNVDVHVLEEEASNEPDKATAVLVAAKNGIKEMVKEILEKFPIAMFDLDNDEKNIVLLAVEYRQSHVYEFMNKRKILMDSLFGSVDKNGNSALHLVAKPPKEILWSMPGAVPQLQREIQWFKRVLHSMDVEFFATSNNEGKTAQQVFTEAHKDLVEEAGKWMSRTSNSCSVIAALVAGVSFNSVATVPGGPNQISGVPILFDKSPFQFFAFSSLLSFCLSVFSLVMFLIIISSRYREQDFEWDLPAKLILGLTSLFYAILAMLVSFGAGNLFVVDMELNYVAFAIYGFFFFLAFLFAVWHFFPFGVELFQAFVAPHKSN